MVSFPLLPWATLRDEGLAEMEKLPFPELVPPTFTETTPEDAAKLASPGYWAITWCAPAVVKEVW